MASKIELLTEAEAIRNTGMYAGLHTPADLSKIVLSGGLAIVKNMNLIGSMIQLANELIANAIDISYEAASVNKIYQEFDAATMTGVVYNNGPSIPVHQVDVKGHGKLWVPEMAATKLHASSNHDKATGHKRISLGCHGVGMKAVLALCVLVIIECVDKKRKLYYKQIVRNGMSVIEPPVVVSDRNAPAEIRRGGTRITYTHDMGLYKELPKGLAANMNSVLQANAHLLSSFLNRGAGKMAYHYNGALVKTRTVKDLAKMFFKDHVLINLTHPEWDLDIVIGEITDDSEPMRVSVINGGFIQQGIHFKYVMDNLATTLRSRVEMVIKKKRRWSKGLVSSNIHILIVGNIPDLLFNAQVKNDLQMLNHKEYMKKYVWPDSDGWKTRIAKFVKSRLMFDMMITKTTRDTQKLLDPRRSIHARNIGTAQSNILIFEGESAMSAAREAMSNGDVEFDQDYNGLLQLRGPPPNAIKKSSKMGRGGVEFINRGDLDKNEIWTTFLAMMNLKYELAYVDDSEFDTLNYKLLTLVVDKDFHGMGKIGPLLISNILFFWPALVNRPHFLAFMDTPVIRAYPNNKTHNVIGFSSVDEFNEWRIQKFGDGAVSGYEVSWIKGLATHSDQECAHMFGRFDQIRIEFTNDDKLALIKYDERFGRDADVRKRLLKSAAKPIPHVENRKTMEHSLCIDHYVHEEQDYNNQCKLPNLDGLILSHRRIVMGVLKYMRDGGNKKLKVYQLAAYIAMYMNYHHGDASLHGALIWLAQNYVGAREIPLLMALSQFGTRMRRDDAGAPRYIDTRGADILTMMFPLVDMPLLDMMMEDGQYFIPKSLEPILPFMLLMSRSTPGTGYKYVAWARHIDDVVENVDSLMSGRPLKKMRPWLPNWHGEVIIDGNKEYSVGTCVLNGDTVTITELPYGMSNELKVFGTKTANGEWPSSSLMGKELIRPATIHDRSTKTAINISFKLRPGAMVVIEKEHTDISISALQQYIGLKKRLEMFLNTMNSDGVIVEYPSYESTMYEWFSRRYETYRKRLVYQATLIRLRIRVMREKIRYISLDIDLKDKKRARQDEILSTHVFQPVNTARLIDPGATTPKAIRAAVYGSGSSFKYLHMSHDDMSEEAVAELNKKIAILMAELQRISSRGAIKEIWRDEIAAIVPIIRAGSASGWAANEGYKY